MWGKGSIGHALKAWRRRTQMELWGSFHDRFCQRAEFIWYRHCRGRGRCVAWRGRACAWLRSGTIWFAPRLLLKGHRVCSVGNSMHHDRRGCFVSSGVPVSYRLRVGHRTQANANNTDASSKQRSKANSKTAHAKKDIHADDVRLAYCTGGVGRLVVDLAARGIRAEQWVVHAAVCVSCLGVRWLGQV